jgi:hypothetical protein
MRRLKMAITAIALLCLCSVPMAAYADNDGLSTEPLQELNVTAYPATLLNVVNAAIKLGAIDISTDEVIDDYAKLRYCSIYEAHHLDEFTWRKVRVALRNSLEKEKDSFPTIMYLEKQEHFGQYDFSVSALLMQPDSIMHNVTKIRLINGDHASACGSDMPHLSYDFISILDKPLWIDSIKMSDQEAQAIVSGMTTKAEQDTVTRTAYGRYIISLDGTGHAPPGMANSVVFLTHIIRVTFYEDPQYQKPFWRGLSSLHGNPELHKTIQGIPFKGIDEVIPPAAPPKSLPLPGGGVVGSDSSGNAPSTPGQPQ